jgi:biopolymer transport protein ExbD
MPIQFRCMHCGQMLSISSRKMGSTVNCPACTEPIRVPGEVDPTAQLDQVKATASANTPAVPAPAPSRPAAATVPAKASVPAKSPNLWADEEEDEDAPRGMRDSRIANDGLDMTPMVDVTFQLLIFFMITASFVTQKSLQTSPPEPDDEAGQVAMQVEEDDQAPVIVGIAEDGSIVIDDFPVEPSAVLETLTAKIAAENRASLLIEAEYNAPHGMVILVMDSGISAGMQSIRKSSRKNE